MISSDFRETNAVFEPHAFLYTILRNKPPYSRGEPLALWSFLLLWSEVHDVAKRCGAFCWCYIWTGTCPFSKSPQNSKIKHTKERISCHLLLAITVCVLRGNTFRHISWRLITQCLLVDVQLYLLFCISHRHGIIGEETKAEPEEREKLFNAFGLGFSRCFEAERTSFICHKTSWCFFPYPWISWPHH